MKKSKFGRVLCVDHVTPASATMDLLLDEPLGFEGGQYIICDTGGCLANGKPVKRAYTIISSDNDQMNIRLGIRLVSNGSRSLMNHVEGDKIAFGGPYGKCKFVPLNNSDEVIFLCTDTGINSALSHLNSSAFKGLASRSHLHWWVGEEQDYLTQEYVLRKLPERLKSFTYRLADPVGAEGRIAQILDDARQVMQRDPGGPVYIAGDGAVVEPLKRLAFGVGRLEEQVRCEYFFQKPKAPDGPKKGMRDGYTTGACAAAAAKAATYVAQTGREISKVTTTLPNGTSVTFALHRCEVGSDNTAVASVIKDGGDDPDVTHGAELIAKVRLQPQSGVDIKGGLGVAVVTKPGLGLEVGGPAINPVPMQNITEMVEEELQARSHYKGAEVEISVPDGEKRAKHTLNGRLGLLYGISILGTTGIVKPYSTAAFVASVVQGVELAKVDGQRNLVLTTGGRSEMFAIKLLPNLALTSFIQVGDYIGIGIRNAIRKGLEKVYIVAMMGKLSKMADGKMMTHASKSAVNMHFLSQLAATAGADRATVAQIRHANTARHVLELCQKAGVDDMPSIICQKVVSVVTAFARSPLAIEVIMVDFKGNVIGGGHSDIGGEIGVVYERRASNSNS